MHYKRHYLQYRDLVFDEYDMISDEGANYSFRQSSQSYSFQHGSYTPFKRKGVTFDSATVSMTLFLRMNKLPCEDRKYYIRYVKEQLTTQGKLWAVQDNSLVWAYAYLTNWAEGEERRGEYEIDVSFAIPEGVWHKADLLRTFLVPFDICDLCIDYKDPDPCGDCCVECLPKPMDNGCGCCTCIEKDMALCYHKDDIQNFYDCTNPYRIVYDCEMGEKYFSNATIHWGQKFAAKCADRISVMFYSDTDIPTDGVNILLIGQMRDPYIEINGNGNYIKGEYDGSLLINSDGSVYYYQDDCDGCEQLDVNSWVIPAGMDYGWVVNPGKNRIIIDGGMCCDLTAYVDVDRLAF